MTLYLQDVLHLPPSTAGLIFGVPGLGSVVAGIVAGRIIAHCGARSVLLTALLVQGGLTAPLILLGSEPIWLWLLIPALFVGFLGHITAVVAATVTATSEVPEADAGLATGRNTGMTMPQWSSLAASVRRISTFGHALRKARKSKGRIFVRELSNATILLPKEY